jgi:hypothetical protein
MADHRLDGGAAFSSVSAFAAAISGVRENAGERVADERLHGGDDGCERVAVIGVAGQRRDMGDWRIRRNPALQKYGLRSWRDLQSSTRALLLVAQNLALAKDYGEGVVTIVVGEEVKTLGTAPVPFIMFRKPYALVAVEIGPWIVELIVFKYVMNLVDSTENALDT